MKNWLKLAVWVMGVAVLPVAHATDGVIEINKARIDANPANGMINQPGSYLEIQNSDTLNTILARHTGKQVKLRLKGGEELGGIVTSVGANVVHLSELSGKEFYDATVSLDTIGAVIIRAR